MKQCHRQDQIEPYLLGELSAADESAFEAHCRQCESCARQMEVLRSAVLSLQPPNEQQSLEDCFSQIQREVSTANLLVFQPPAKSVASSHARRWLGVAASLALVCGTWAVLSARRAAPDPFRLTINWEQDGNLVTAYNDQPVVRDGKVFTLRTEQGENQLLALSKEDGSLVWKAPIGQTSRIVADEQQVFIGQFSGNVFSISALSVADGSKKWTCDHAFAGKHPHNIVFQLAANRLNWITGRTLYSFDTDHGELMWKTRLNNEKESYAMPVYQEGNLLVVGSRNMYTLDDQTGSIVRLQPHSENYNHYLNPKVASDADHLFVASTTKRGKGRIICYSTHSGRQLWLREMQQVKNIQTTEGLLIVKNDQLEAYDVQDGSRVWREPIGGCYKVAFLNQKIFAIHNTDPADIIALSAKTGHRIRSYAISGQADSDVLLAGKNRFLSTTDGRLIAMHYYAPELADESADL